MGLSLTHEVLSLALRDPFRIARADHNEGTRITTVVVEVRDDRFPDVVGVGEGYPDRFYGETPDTMAVVMPMLLASIETTDIDYEVADAAAGLARIATRDVDPTIRGHGAAKCALDIALHDLVGKVVGRPVHALLGVSAEIPPTDFTIGIDAPGIVAERAARAADFPALKVKCGGPADLETLRAVREVFSGPIRVDANTGWSRADAEALLPELVDLGVELIEQPFPARAYRDLGWLQERSSLPIVADESAVGYEDLDALVGVGGGREREIGEVRRDRAPPGRCSTERESSGSGRSWAAWRRPRSGSRRRRSSPRWRIGSTSTATCCSRTIRSTAWSSGRTSAGS